MCIHGPPPLFLSVSECQSRKLVLVEEIVFFWEGGVSVRYVNAGYKSLWHFYKCDTAHLWQRDLSQSIQISVLAGITDLHPPVSLIRHEHTNPLHSPTICAIRFTEVTLEGRWTKSWLRWNQPFHPSKSHIPRSFPFSKSNYVFAMQKEKREWDKQRQGGVVMKILIHLIDLMPMPSVWFEIKKVGCSFGTVGNYFLF